ncbi:MAG: hypothetical protein H0T62_00030 [Parachlamydiaceae bacterium]|nr:hypothetical protein [Parachlamydiaceae bacterium]
MMKTFDELVEAVKLRELSPEEVKYILQKIKELTLTIDMDLSNWIYLLGFVKKYEGFEAVISKEYNRMTAKTIEDFRLLAAYCPGLESISLGEPDDEVLAFLDLFPKLLRFHLCYGSYARKKGLKHVWRLSQLTHLSLGQYCEINDIFFHKLFLLEQLVDLSLIWCKYIYNRNLKQIAKLEHLHSLDLDSSLRITNEGMRYIATMKNLLCLGLGNTPISDHGVLVLSNLPALQELSLRNCEITDRSLKYLSSFQNLESIDLSFCEKITDKGLLYLSKFEKLKIVNLTHCGRITDCSIKKLPPQIQVIRKKPFGMN